MNNYKLGFIGSGKMAGAIIKGLIKTGFATPYSIIATQLEQDGLEEKSSELGVEIILDNKVLVQKSDIIFIAVKPNQVLSVLEEIKPFVNIKRLH
jgi:pyrroline-5-carboxylate reductase